MGDGRFDDLVRLVVVPEPVADVLDLVGGPICGISQHVFVLLVCGSLLSSIRDLPFFVVGELGRLYPLSGLATRPPAVST